MAWYHSHLEAYYSKITLPKLLKDGLLQDNIIRIIDSIPLDKAACMIAPFGYGKTQAALQWLNKSGFRCAYYCLDGSDNRVDLFFGGLIAAVLSAVSPYNLGVDLMDYHNYLENPRNFLHNIVLSVREEQGDYAFIIKNIHCIKDPDALECLKELIELFLGYWKVLIIDREKLPPVFNHLIMTGSIHPITVAELRLDSDRIGEFLKRGGLEAGPDDIEWIWSQTQGWFAALNAVLTTSIEEHNLDYSDIVKSIIAEYFETEIWQNLDDNTRVLLMKTSILDILNPSACYALTDITETKKVLNQLYARGVFILLNKNGKYHYHPAFKEFLQQKLENSNTDINDLYAKYGWWLRDQKEYAAAFQCFYKVKFLYGIDRMLKKYNPTVMSIESFLDMTRNITSLDPNELKQYPNIVAKMALIEYLTGNLERMRELKDIFLTWSKPGILPIDSDDYAYYYWEGGWLVIIDPEETQKRNKRIYDMINFKNYAPYLELQYEARMAVLGFPSIFRGTRDFSELADIIRSFIRQVDEDNQDFIQDEYALMESRLVLAEYYYETESFAKAMEQIRIIMPITAGLTHAKLYLCCVALLSKIMRALSDINEIGDMIVLLEKKIIEKGSDFLLPNFHALLQRNHLADGNTGFLEVFYRENSPLIENDHFYLLYRKIAYVRALISLKKYHNALIILQSLELLCERYKRVVDLIEVCVLKSIILYYLKDDIHAVSCLKKAYDIAKPYGYIRVFTDDASELMPVLNLLYSELSEGYLKKIIISAKKTAYGNTTISKRNPYIDLTKSELKILNSLRKNLSYAEISMEHNIKLTTVKKHTQSIYGKLGVRNKIDAVATAIRHRILKD